MARRRRRPSQAVPGADPLSPLGVPTPPSPPPGAGATQAPPPATPAPPVEEVLEAEVDEVHELPAKNGERGRILDPNLLSDEVDEAPTTAAAPPEPEPAQVVETGPPARSDAGDALEDVIEQIIGGASPDPPHAPVSRPHRPAPEAQAAPPVAAAEPAAPEPASFDDEDLAPPPFVAAPPPRVEEAAEMPGVALDHDDDLWASFGERVGNPESQTGQAPQRLGDPAAPMEAPSTAASPPSVRESFDVGAQDEIGDTDALAEDDDPDLGALEVDESALIGEALEEEPDIHMATFRARLGGNNVLPLPMPEKGDQIDEVNHALGAFADLQFGQTAMIRFSIRSVPGFKSEAKAWLKARKHGEDPDAPPQSVPQRILGYLGYFLRHLFHAANEAAKPGSGGEPPQAPWSRGKNLTPLPASQIDEDEKQAWKDSAKKAQDTAHFEVVMRAAAFGSPEHSEELDMIAEQTSAGFEAIETPHQNIVWESGNPLDTALGFMGARPPADIGMILSANELANLAHVPDDLLSVHGVQVSRSPFKHLPIPQPILVEDPLNPPPGLVPIGVVGAGSDDEKVIAMDNSTLDQHMIVVGKTGSGKALDVDTPIATPDGWKKMGDLVEGDHVFDSRGHPTKVVQAFPVLHGRPTYEVVFSDGTVIVADGEHQWTTSTRAARISAARESAFVPSRLEWVAAVEERLRRSPDLHERVFAAQVTRELEGVVPASAIQKVYSSSRHKTTERVAMPEAYGTTTVVKSRDAEVITRGRLYEGLIEIGSRTGRAFRGRLTEPAVVTTEEIARTLRTQTGHANHAIPLVAQEIQHDEQVLTVDPYLLGLWLGDGNSHIGRITSGDHEEVIAEIEQLGREIGVVADKPGSQAKEFGVLNLTGELRDLGLLRNKHIPEIYLHSSPDQRWALLQGLLDSDGSVTRHGSCDYYSSDRALAEQVVELVAGLGLQPRLRQKRAVLDGRDMGPTWTVTFMSDKPAFRLQRKAKRQKLALSSRARLRYIVDVRRIPSRPVRCIAVDAADHLYLAGKTFVPTHNSEWMKWILYGIAKADYPLVVIDPHGQLSEEILNALIVNCPDRLKDIVYCDLSNPQYPVALNPLDVHSMSQVEATVGSVVEMLGSPKVAFDKGGAPRAMVYAKEALTALCHANLELDDPQTKCTLLDVMNFFTVKEFRHLVIEFCQNEVIRQKYDFDTGIFEQLSDKDQVAHVQPIVRAISELGNSESFSAVFSSPQNKLDFGRLIGSNKIVIVKLAQFAAGGQAELGSFVGSLILPWLLSTMDTWGRKKDPITGLKTGRGCRVLVDEAPTLMGPNSSVPETLAQSRKWDLGLFMAAQFLDQFDAGIIDAALGNTNSKVSLVQDPNKAGKIAKAIAGASNRITDKDVAGLPNYHFYGNVLLPSGPTGPFSAKALLPISDKLAPGDIKVREQVIEASRAIVANDKEEIRRISRQRLDNVMNALKTKLRERADTDYTPPPMFTDDDLDDEFSGWAG